MEIEIPEDIINFEPKFADPQLGKCCENFALLISPVDLYVSYKCSIEQKQNKRILLNPSSKNLLRDEYTIWQDIHLTYPMVEFLYADHVHPNGNTVHEDIIWYHYRCRHHNKETGKCMIYEIRPKMCITFPEGEPCKYEGCACPGDCRDIPFPYKTEEIKAKEHWREPKVKPSVNIDQKQIGI